MALKLVKKNRTKEDAIEVVFWHNGTRLVRRWNAATGDLRPEDDPELESVTFWIRPLDGRDVRTIADQLSRGDRRGDTRTLYGTVGSEKCVRCVIAVDDLVDENGNEVHKWSRAIYDQLPGWICDPLLEEVNYINGEGADDSEGE